jgi:hypothetical protein
VPPQSGGTVPLPLSGQETNVRELNVITPPSFTCRCPHTGFRVQSFVAIDSQGTAVNDHR